MHLSQITYDVRSIKHRTQKNLIKMSISTCFRSKCIMFPWKSKGDISVGRYVNDEITWNSQGEAEREVFLCQLTSSMHNLFFIELLSSPNQPEMVRILLNHLLKPLINHRARVEHITFKNPFNFNWIYSLVKPLINSMIERSAARRIHTTEAK